MQEKRTLLNGLILGAIASCAILLFCLIYNQQKMLNSQTQYQKQRIEQQATLLTISSNRNFLLLMTHVLDKVENELENSPTRTLGDETLSRIAELSASFQPYAYWESDSLSAQKLSPERGQLFLELTKMDMDSSSFSRIKAMVTFAGADLGKADLRKMNLRGVDLKEANLREANMAETILTEAFLNDANLWGVNLKKAKLKGADLRRTDLRWADMDSTNLKRADLNGAMLEGATLRKADLSGAGLQWAFMHGALLHDANLSGVNLWATDLSRANLSGADLTEANVSGADLTEANLTGVELTKVNLEENWFEKLTEWKVTGTAAIQKAYKIESGIDGFYHSWLIKRED